MLSWSCNGHEITINSIFGGVLSFERVPGSFPEKTFALLQS
jgi:hypothetical protein